VTSVTYPNAQTITAAWNLAGNASTVTYPNGTLWRYLYDPRLALKEVDNFYVAWNTMSTYAVDANGQRTGEVMSGNGSRTWGRNAATDTVDTYQQLQTGYPSINTVIRYDKAGRVALDCKATATCNNTPGGDTYTTNAYDTASQLLGATVTNDTTTGDTIGWAYTYGNRGNRTAETVTTKTSGGSSAVTTNYRYVDNTSQMCAARTGATPTDCTTDPLVTAKWTYDGAGRRATAVTPLYNATFSYNPRGDLSRRPRARRTNGGVTTRSASSTALPTPPRCRARANRPRTTCSGTGTPATSAAKSPRSCNRYSTTPAASTGPTAATG